MLYQKKKKHQGEVPQRGFKGAQVLVMVNKGQDERKSHTSTKQKQGGTRFGQQRIRRL